MNNDGGPAFPTPSGCSQYGMTLRDYFAGQALIGLLSCTHRKPRPSSVEDARDSYALADAMLAERAERDGKESA